MQESVAPKLAKWPFVVGDVLLLGVAFALASKGGMGLWETALVFLCVAAGSALCVLPFLLEYSATVKLAEAQGLTTVVSEMENIEAVGAKITEATAQWQTVQEHAGTTSAAAKQIAEKMAAEVRAFTEFMQRINDTEKATLKLEAEKLHRAEGEWLQVVVRMLDHTYALYLGAVRSGQPNLIEQMGRFQHDCIDAAHRMGLVPFSAQPSEAFNPQLHQLLDQKTKPAESAVVEETLATGYTYQGRLLRQALVRLHEDQPASAEQIPPASSETPAPSEPSTETPPESAPESSAPAEETATAEPDVVSQPAEPAAPATETPAPVEVVEETPAPSAAPEQAPNAGPNSETPNLL